MQSHNNNINHTKELVRVITYSRGIARILSPSITDNPQGLEGEIQVNGAQHTAAPRVPQGNENLKIGSKQVEEMTLC